MTNRGEINEALLREHGVENVIQSLRAILRVLPFDLKAGEPVNICLRKDLFEKRMQMLLAVVEVPASGIQTKCYEASGSKILSCWQNGAWREDLPFPNDHVEE